MRDVAGVIREADADVVLLQEVEDEAALERLNTMLDGMGYQPHFVQDKDSFTGQDVAMLSRLEASRVFRVNDKGQSGGVESQVTKNLVATFELPDGDKLAVLTAHFLARPDAKDRQLKREAQADAIPFAQSRLALDQIVTQLCRATTPFLSRHVCSAPRNPQSAPRPAPTSGSRA